MAESRDSRRAEGAATLDTVVETVRRILRADTAEHRQLLRVRAHHHVAGDERLPQRLEPGGLDVVNPVRGEFAERAAAFDREEDEPIFEVRGLAGDLPGASSRSTAPRACATSPSRACARAAKASASSPSASASTTASPPRSGSSWKGSPTWPRSRSTTRACSTRSARPSASGSRPSTPSPTASSSTTTGCASCAATWPRPRRWACHPSDVVGMSCAEAFARLFGERAAAYHMRPGTPRTISSFELQAEDGRRYLVAVAPLSSLESEAGVRVQPTTLNSPGSRLLLRGA